MSMTPPRQPQSLELSLAVFGATGPTGRLVVSEALDASHHVAAAARHPEAITTRRPGLRVVAVDVADPGADLTQVLVGADAVLSALGSHSRQPTTVYSQGGEAIAAAMAAEGVGRLIAISSAGIEIPPGLPWAQRVVMSQIIGRFYRHQYSDRVRMEAYLEHSPLDWTVIRAPRLTDGPPTGRTRISLDAPILDATSLHRADLARFIIAAVQQPDTYRRRAYLASPRR